MSEGISCLAAVQQFAQYKGSDNLVCWKGADRTAQDGARHDHRGQGLNAALRSTKSVCQHEAQSSDGRGVCSKVFKGVLCRGCLGLLDFTRHTQREGARKPFANPSPTFRQPFANLSCQPLSKLLFHSFCGFQSPV